VAICTLASQHPPAVLNLFTTRNGRRAFNVATPDSLSLVSSPARRTFQHGSACKSNTGDAIGWRTIRVPSHERSRDVTQPPTAPATPLAVKMLRTP